MEDDFLEMAYEDRFECDLDNWELTQLSLDQHYEENEENLDEWEELEFPECPSIDEEDGVEEDLAQNPWGVEGVV